MLKPKPPQNSFYGSYLYDRIIPPDHLLRKINAVVDFSFVNDFVKDRYTPDFGRPAEDPEFMLRLCILQYIYGDSDREVEQNARINLAYKYFLGLAVDEEPPDSTAGHTIVQNVQESTLEIQTKCQFKSSTCRTVPPTIYTHLRKVTSPMNAQHS